MLIMFDNDLFVVVKGSFSSNFTEAIKLAFVRFMEVWLNYKIFIQISCIVL